MIEDIRDAWMIFLLMIVLCVIISIVYFYLVQMCAGVLTFLIIICGLIGLFGLGFFCWQRRITTMKEVEFDQSVAENYKKAAIVFWVLGGIFLLLVLCLCSQIKLAVKMIQAASDFITDRKSVLLSPIFSYILLIAFLMFWLPSFAYVFSVGELKTNKNEIFADIIWP